MYFREDVIDLQMGLSVPHLKFLPKQLGAVAVIGNYGITYPKWQE